MFNEATRFSGLPNVTYLDSEKILRARINALWVRAPLPEQKKLFDLSLEFLDLSAARRGKNFSDKRVIAEDARLTANAYARFVSHVAKHYDLFGPEGKNEAKANLESMITPVVASSPIYAHKTDMELRAIKLFRKAIFESFLNSKPENLQDFFALIHRHNLADIFAPQISSHDFSMRVGTSYRQWLKRHSNELASDSLKFAVTHQGPSPSLGFDNVKDLENLMEIGRRRYEINALKSKSHSPFQEGMYARILDLLDYCELAVSIPLTNKSKAEFIEGLAEKYSRVYVQAARHFRAYTDEDREQIAKSLAVLLLVPQPSDSQRAGENMEEYTARYLRDQKEILGHVAKDTYHDFFRALHQYGFTAHFGERVKAGYVPVKMLTAYDAWDSQNKQWIDNKEWLSVPVTAPAAAAKVPVVTAPAPKTIVSAQPTAIAAEPVPVSIDKPVLVSSSEVADKGTEEPSLPLSLLRKKLREEKRLKGWDLSTPAPVAPPVVAKIKDAVEYPDPEEIDWDELDRQTAPAVQPAESELQVAAGDTPDPAVAVSNEVTPVILDIAGGFAASSLIMPVIKVRLRIISSDEDVRDQGICRAHRAASKYKDGQGQDDSHDRTGILRLALAQDSSNMIVDTYIQPVDVNTEKKERPYNVVDIELPANEAGTVDHARIFVCNFHGFATFIQRGMAERFDPDDEVDMSALRDDPKVWIVPFQSDEQWVRDVQHRLYTPVNDMEVQLKRAHFWASRAAALEETFVEYVVRHGRIPDDEDKRVIDFGPLAGQATWAAGKAALRRQTVGGLENIRSYKSLLTHLCGKYPELSHFVAKQPVRVNACVLKESLEDGATCVAGWEPGLLKLAFRYGAVECLEAVVPDGQARPASFEEFATVFRAGPL